MNRFITGETCRRAYRRPHTLLPLSRSLRPVFLLPFLLAACSMLEQQNRRTLNALDASVAPASTAGRWALAPLALPAGLVALALDAALVHPACVLDDAWGDTVEWLWSPDPQESRFRRAMLLPLSALATPVVWAGDWLGRVLFAIPPRPAGPAPDTDRAGSGNDASAALDAHRDRP